MSNKNASDNAQGPDFELGAIHNGLIVVKQSSIAKIIEVLDDENPPPLEDFKDALTIINECGCLPPCPPGTPPGTFCD